MPISEPGLTRLVVPATHQSLRVVRLTTVAAVQRLGADLADPADPADLDKVEDLRLAISEACALLIECAVPTLDRPDLIEITIRCGRGGVRIRAERQHASLVHSPPPISVAILDAICDRWHLLRGPVVSLRWYGNTERC